MRCGCQSNRTAPFGVAGLGERRRLAGTTSRSPSKHVFPRVTSDATSPRYTRGGRVRWRARRAGWQSSCAARMMQSRNDTKQITAQVYTALGNATQSLGNFATARGAHAPCPRLQRTNILPWMACCCLLGWSASSHELECAQVRCLRQGARHLPPLLRCQRPEARGNAPNARQRRAPCVSAFHHIIII